MRRCFFVRDRNRTELQIVIERIEEEQKLKSGQKLSTSHRVVQVNIIVLQRKQ